MWRIIRSRASISVTANFRRRRLRAHNQPRPVPKPLCTRTKPCQRYVFKARVRVCVHICVVRLSVPLSCVFLCVCVCGFPTPLARTVRMPNPLGTRTKPCPRQELKACVRVCGIFCVCPCACLLCVPRHVSKACDCVCCFFCVCALHPTATLSFWLILHSSLL